jgi:hypothetical protein
MEKIKLDCGVTVTLRKLYQSYTYEGVLAGLPTKSWSDRRLAEALDLARSQPILGIGEPVLIEPKIKLVQADYLPEPSPFLPEITCIGLFWVSYIEVLTVVWFQNEMAMPIDPDVLKSIKALDWRALAMEYEI